MLPHVGSQRRHVHVQCRQGDCRIFLAHTVHATLLSNPCCAVDRWATIIAPRWFPEVEVSQRVCQLDQFVFGSVATSGRICEDTGLAGTPPAQRSRSVRHHTFRQQNFAVLWTQLEVRCVGAHLVCSSRATPRHVTQHRKLQPFFVDISLRSSIVDSNWELPSVF